MGRRLRHAIALLTMVCAGAGSGCRTLLGPDDARPPPPDGSDGSDALGGLDGADDGGDVRDGFARLACDLRLQDCPDRRGCYPDEAFSGDTVCLPRGSGGPLSPCAMQTDCDARLVCLLSPDDPAGRVCAELCRAGAEVTGCQVGQSCLALPGYDVGYCGF